MTRAMIDSSCIILALVCIYITAWLIQDNLFLNWDVSQLLHVTELMIQGGTYTNDFFIPNPPMVLYLYSLPVLLTKLTGANLILEFRAYIFILLSLSLASCYILLKKIFSANDKSEFTILFLTISICFFIAPLYEFGQRDILLFTFIVPYGLLLTARLDNHNINKQFAIFIGLLAGIGVGFKPQFFSTFVLLELFFCLRKRDWLTWLRAETLTVILFTLLYTLSVIILFPEYISVIIPYLTQNYYSRIKKTYLEFIWFYPVVYALISPSMFIATFNYNKHKSLCFIFCIMIIGFIISFISQKNYAYYHYLPIFACSVILNIFCMSTFILAGKSIKNNYLILIPGVLLLSFYCYFLSTIWTNIVFHPTNVYFFLGAVFFILLCVYNEKQILQNLFKTMIVTTTIIYSANIISKTSLYPHATLIIIMIYCILFAFCAKKRSRDYLTLIYTAYLSLLVLSFPVNEIQNIFYKSLFFKNNKLETLIHFAEMQKKPFRLMTLSPDISILSPLIHYTKVKPGQRFDCLWMIVNLNNYLHDSGEEKVINYIKTNRDRYFFVNMIAEDIKLRKPDIIIVDHTSNIIWKNKLEKFDYLHFFTANLTFAKEWKEYNYLTELKAPPYLYSVYKRINSNIIFK